VIFRLFPQDFEAVGSYRLIYPYGLIEQNTEHEVVVEVGERKGKKIELFMPDPDGDVPEEDIFVFQSRLENDAARVVEWLASEGKTVVVELDDWWWDIPKGAPAQHALKTVEGISLKALKRQVSAATLVTVSTPMLAEMVGKWNDNVHILPNYLHRSDWQDITPSYEKERKQVRIGWMGKLRYRGKDLDVLRGVIGPWLERHPECVFAQVGDEGTEVLDLIGVPEGQRLQYQGQIFPKHAASTSMIDIGLVPLEQSVFNECKSHLKGMEYAACGIPCIATPTGPYQEWVEDGVNGFLASKPKDWFNALDASLECWREMGRNAHRKVQGHMIDDRWSEWLKPYGSILAVENSSSKATSTLTTHPTSNPTSSPALASI